MELKGRNLTPERFCVMVDSLYQTASLRNYSIQFRGKTYTHFGPGRYYIDDDFVSLSVLLEEVKKSLLHVYAKETLILGYYAVQIYKGKICTSFKIFNGVDKRDVVSNAVRWFDTNKIDEINLLKSIYKNADTRNL